VFLHAAQRRLKDLGGSPSAQVRGIEIARETFDQNHARFAGADNSPRLVFGDFFDISPEQFGQVNAIVGNPPFIRYQRFNGDARQKALRRARKAGVGLSELSSSWAPFLVHATTFITDGGRLAVVAPAELVHAAYAKPVISHLSRAFATVRILVFGRRLFPDLSEDTVLVLAEGRGEAPKSLTIHSLDDSSALGQVDILSASAVGESTDGWTSGVTRFLEYFVPDGTRDLYRELRRHSRVVRLGDAASVGIGYVTGNNDYFHLSAEEAKQLGIPRQDLRRSVRNARKVRGLTFSSNDWVANSGNGEKNLLLYVRSSEDRLPSSLSKYLARGVRKGVPKAYKCRTRDPWYSVPHVHVGDAFLTYMNGGAPKLFLNRAKAVAPNTLHVVRMRTDSTLTATQLAAGWMSSLTQLSCEIEGHSMGGGMLKLEPRESAKVSIPLVSIVLDHFDELDSVARTDGQAAATQEIDRLVREELGISHRDIDRLRDATLTLRERRTSR
jgi:hypothetical protein